MATTVRHWLGTKKYQLGQQVRKLAYRTQTPLGRRAVNRFWEEQAAIIHELWGEEQHDFAVLSAIFATHQPKSILDVGCGSGRLFGHYLAHGITDIVGTDISETALAIANERYPQVPTATVKVEALAFPPQRFDLVICNRVLQHIPPNAIESAIGKLCTIGKVIYVNELTESDQLDEEFFMFRHDYTALFAARGLRLQGTGHIHPHQATDTVRNAGNSKQQTYYLFSA